MVATGGTTTTAGFTITGAAFAGSIGDQSEDAKDVMRGRWGVPR